MDMERSFEFNNAGVDCIEAGYHKVAWDLFKGALEVKLAVERSGLENHENLLDSRSNSNSYIQKAEAHLLNLDAYLSHQGHNPNMLLPPAVSSSQISPRRRQPSGDVASDSLYTPFLFSKPLRLETNPDLSTRRESATIIFNLALVDHLKNHCSEQAVALYELAMTLVTGDVVDILGIALINNIGVWCYENGDMDGALACMGHLANFIGSCHSFIDAEEKVGLQSNILWLMNPPFTASPAA
jgi:hypothetical protein